MIGYKYEKKHIEGKEAEEVLKKLSSSQLMVPKEEGYIKSTKNGLLLEKLEKQLNDNPIVDKVEDVPVLAITNSKHIKELQYILVQTCLDFINKYGLTDIYSVSFNADELAYSAQYGEWHPATDSYIKIEGIRIEKHRRKNGEIIDVPINYTIGERF